MSDVHHCAVAVISWGDRNAGAREFYDPDAPMDDALGDSIAAVDGRLYAISLTLADAATVDASMNARNLDVNEACNPESNRWERLSPIPTARSGSLRGAGGSHLRGRRRGNDWHFPSG